MLVLRQLRQLRQFRQLTRSRQLRDLMHSRKQWRAILLTSVLTSLLAACAGVTPGNTPSLTTSSTTATTQSTTPPSTHQITLPPLDPQLLLNRVSWGANAHDLQQIQQLGIERYLQQQLWSSAALPSAVQTQINALSISQQRFEQRMRALEAQREQAQQQKGVDDSLRKAYQQALTHDAREAASRLFWRALYSPNQLLEQMNWFWLNHFSISIQKNNLRAMLGDYEEHAIHPHALGKFRDLLRATLMHPAMLRYLDNEHNSVGRINENYARELLELHTMGVDGGYSQHDVQELARILTGVGIHLNDQASRVKPALQGLLVRQGLFEFNPSRHDFGDKQLLGKTIRGSGFQEIEEVLNLLSRQPATARFISRKLANYLVSDNPSEQLVSAMAQEFLRTDGDIPSVLRVLFISPEFAASLGHQFKDPIHYVMSSMRLAYGDTFIPNTTPLLNWLNQMGQTPGGRQTPDGYALQETNWTSAGQLATRFDIAKIMANDNPNLFRRENDDGSVTNHALVRPLQTDANLIKQWASTYSAATQQTLRQAANAQEWNALFLAAPETMRR